MSCAARPPEDNAELAALDVLRHLEGFGTPASLKRRVGVWSHDPALDQQAAERAPTCPTCAGTVPSRGGVR